jgi:hypothetical protein
MADYTRIRPGSVYALRRSGGAVPETGYYRHPKPAAISERKGKKKRGKGGFPPFSRRLLGRRATWNARQKLVAGRREIWYDGIISPDFLRDKLANLSCLPIPE